MIYSNQARSRRAFENRVRVKYNDYLKKVTAESAKFKNQVFKIDNYRDIEDLELPENLSNAYGQNLSDIIIISLYLGKRRSRKRPKKSAENLKIINYTDYLDLQLISPQIVLNAAKLPEPDELWELNWDKESKEVLEAFSEEAFTVAGKQTQEMLDTLKSEAKKAFDEGISFHEWRKNIQLKGFEADNPYYLRTNFNTAINSSYLAGNWIQAQVDKDIFPHFRYVGILDDRIRDEHLALHGTILPVDHPFWDTNYPPNDWGCRCDVEQLTQEEAESDKKFGEDPPDIIIDPDFRKNPGKDKKIW